MGKWLAIIGIVLLVILGGGYLYWQHQFGYLPEWYKSSPPQGPGGSSAPPAAPSGSPGGVSPQPSPEARPVPPAEKAIPVKKGKTGRAGETGNTPTVSAPTPAPSSSLGATSPPAVRSASEILEQLDRADQVTISEEELPALVLNTVDEKWGVASEEFIRGTKSRITPEQVSVEMVVDMRKIPWEKLPPRLQTIRRFTGYLVPGRGAEVYVRFAGKPVLKGQRLRLGEDATVQIGRIRYTLKNLLDLVGENDLLLEGLPLTEAPFTEVELKEGMVLLKK